MCEKDIFPILFDTILAFELGGAAPEPFADVVVGPRPDSDISDPFAFENVDDAAEAAEHVKFVLETVVVVVVAAQEEDEDVDDEADADVPGAVEEVAPTADDEAVDDLAAA